MGSLIKKNKKAIFIAINTLALSIFMYVFMWNISKMQYSDGIPMLIRLQKFKNGECSIFQYLFWAHGNSIHPMVYIAAFLDDIFFNNNMVVLRAATALGMIFGATFISYLTYSDRFGVIKNIIIVAIVDIIFAGTYNYELYLPFQMVLTFSRVLFLVVFWKICLSLVSQNEMKWRAWIIISCIVALLHGMGMMFALAIIFVHIATRQRIKKIILSFSPLLFYVCFQWYFNSGVGEATNVSAYFFKYFKELVLAAFAFFGGVPYQLLRLPRNASLFIGAFVFILITLVLGYSLLFGVKTIGFDVKNATIIVYTIGVLSISYLAALGAATFNTARIDCIEAIAKDPTINVLATGRYLCFGVAPYIVLICAIFKKIFERFGEHYLGIIIYVAFLVLLLVDNYKGTLTTISNNRELDKEAVALLSGVELESDYLKLTYGIFSSDKYYETEIPLLFSELKNQQRYIWDNIPNRGEFVGDISELDVVNPFFIDLGQNDGITEIELRTTEKTTRRYNAIITEEGRVVGFAFLSKRPGPYVNSNNTIVYDGYYTYKGFIDSEFSKEEKIYILNEDKSSLTTHQLASYDKVYASDYTDSAGWDHGVMINSRCILFDNNESNSDKIFEATHIGANNIYLKIKYVEKDDLWIRVFVDSVEQINMFKYPNEIRLFK